MQELIDDFSVSETHSNLIDLPDEGLIHSRGLVALVMIAVGFVPGLIFAKLCLEGAQNAMQLYKQEPGKYKKDSLVRVKRGKLMATIGLGIFALELLALISWIYLGDWE